MNGIARVDAVLAGVTKSVLRNLLTSGRWQRVGRSCVATFTGELTEVQRITVAVLSGGPSAVLTGAAALRLLGFRYAPKSGAPVVLVTLSIRRERSAGVRITPTIRLPIVAQTLHGIPIAPTSRAVADACREPGTSLRTARAVAAEAVQRGFTTPALLSDEVRQGPRRWSASLRQAVADIGVGARSAPEAEAMRLLLSSETIDHIEWNVDLIGPAGTFVARPDAWIDSVGVAVEIDSVDHHFLIEDWERTQKRVALLASYGALSIPVVPYRLRSEPEAVLREVEQAFEIRHRAGIRSVLRKSSTAAPR